LVFKGRRALLAAAAAFGRRRRLTQQSRASPLTTISLPNSTGVATPTLEAEGIPDALSRGGRKTHAGQQGP